jgi:copper(I)-binding protein
MPAGANTAVYLTLANEGDEEEVLVGGETPVAGAVEIHESRLEGDVMRMERVQELALPGGNRVVLEPGGLHLMLLGLDRALEAGDTLTLTLHFGASEPQTLLVPVRPPGGE